MKQWVLPSAVAVVSLTVVEAPWTSNSIEKPSEPVEHGTSCVPDGRVLPDDFMYRYMSCSYTDPILGENGAVHGVIETTGAIVHGDDPVYNIGKGPDAIHIAEVAHDAL